MTSPAGPEGPGRARRRRWETRSIAEHLALAPLNRLIWINQQIFLTDADALALARLLVAAAGEIQWLEGLNERHESGHYVVA